MFGFERINGKYVVYVDGVRTWETTAAGLFSMPGYLMLSVEGIFSRGVGTIDFITTLPRKWSLIMFVYILSGPRIE